MTDQRLPYSPRPFDPKGWQSIGMTPEGRVLAQHPEYVHPTFGPGPAGVSSELSATVQNPFGPGYINIPTMYEGIPVSVEEAVEVIRSQGRPIDPETGRQLDVYPSIDAAVQAAKQRSASIPSAPMSVRPQEATMTNPRGTGFPVYSDFIPGGGTLPPIGDPVERDTTGQMRYGNAILSHIQAAGEMAAQVPPQRRTETDWQAIAAYEQKFGVSPESNIGGKEMMKSGMPPHVMNAIERVIATPRGASMVGRKLADRGRRGDTMVAHINPREAAMLRQQGGAGTPNPRTGLPEFAPSVSSKVDKEGAASGFGSDRATTTRTGGPSGIGGSLGTGSGTIDKADGGPAKAAAATIGEDRGTTVAGYGGKVAADGSISGSSAPGQGGQGSPAAQGRAEAAASESGGFLDSLVNVATATPFQTEGLTDIEAQGALVATGLGLLDPALGLGATIGTAMGQAAENEIGDIEAGRIAGVVVETERGKIGFNAEHGTISHAGSLSGIDTGRLTHDIATGAFNGGSLGGYEKRDLSGRGEGLTRTRQRATTPDPDEDDDTTPGGNGGTGTGGGTTTPPPAGGGTGGGTTTTGPLENVTAAPQPLRRFTSRNYAGSYAPNF